MAMRATAESLLTAQPARHRHDADHPADLRHRLRRWAGAAGVLVGLVLQRDLARSWASTWASRAWRSCCIGGLGNIHGAMVGGMALGVVEVLSVAYLASSYRDAFAFAHDDRDPAPPARRACSAPRVRSRVGCDRPVHGVRADLPRHQHRAGAEPRPARLGRPAVARPGRLHGDRRLRLGGAHRLVRRAVPAGARRRRRSRPRSPASPSGSRRSASRASTC